MKKLSLLFLLICLVFSAGCARRARPQTEYDLSVLVFITGVIAGSPSYELMAAGALEFARENPNVRIKIYEAGFNQAEWEQQLLEMVSTGEYDIVLGSNPSLPQLCINVARRFPNQKFIILDAHHEGHPQIKTYFYNQYEQALMLGYLAGLVTTSNMPFANSHRRIGFIAAQEFPLLTRQMIPGFIDGARLVDPEIELDRRIIGSWADANRAAELASAMMDAGVDVFTSIAGGAAQGLIRTAAERGAYIVSFNTNEYRLAPGIIVGCGMIEQKRLVKEVLARALAGEVQFGTSTVLGVREGYIGFIFDELYYTSLPADIRERFEKFLEDLLAGRIDYTIPPL